MKLTMATGNEHKIEELETVLADMDITIDQVSSPPHEIDAHDVETVAKTKVRDAATQTDMDTKIVVDDTGLYVDALNGFPGSHASYFIDRCGKKGLLSLMQDKEDRAAYFKTTMALYYPETDRVVTFSGRCDGRIIREPRGKEGFGYDPVFCPNGHDKTFAEDNEYKHTVSHRKTALDRLVDHLRSTS